MPRTISRGNEAEAAQTGRNCADICSGGSGSGHLRSEQPCGLQEITIVLDDRLPRPPGAIFALWFAVRMCLPVLIDQLIRNLQIFNVF